jgi:transcriptional regulator with XRE-family HTH domain
MKISGKQVAAARELIGITQDELAKALGLDGNTISRFEGGQSEPHRANLAKIQAELERRGIDFTNGDSPPSAGDGIGVRLNFARAAEFAKTAKGSNQ